jgi:hypothetical protein
MDRLLVLGSSLNGPPHSDALDWKGCFGPLRGTRFYRVIALRIFGGDREISPLHEMSDRKISER